MSEAKQSVATEYWTVKSKTPTPLSWKALKSQSLNSQIDLNDPCLVFPACFRLAVIILTGKPFRPCECECMHSEWPSVGLHVLVCTLVLKAWFRAGRQRWESLSCSLWLPTFVTHHPAKLRHLHSCFPENSGREEERYIPVSCWRLNNKTEDSSKYKFHTINKQIYLLWVLFKFLQKILIWNGIKKLACIKSETFIVWKTPSKQPLKAFYWSNNIL